MNQSTFLQDRLLTTKFFIPSPSHTLIPRPSLTAQLSAEPAAPTHARLGSRRLRQDHLTRGLGAIVATGSPARCLGLPG